MKLFMKPVYPVGKYRKYLSVYIITGLLIITIFVSAVLIFFKPEDNLNLPNAQIGTKIDKSISGQTLLQNPDIWDGVYSTLSLAENPFDGAGTQNSPYLIKSARDLAQLAFNVNNGSAAQYRYIGKYFRLNQTISLSGTHSWHPIGKDTNFYFGGTFDGNGRTISNMTISSAQYGATGLFGVIKSTNNASIKRLKLSNVYILNQAGSAVSGDSVYIGGLAAYVEGYDIWEVAVETNAEGINYIAPSLVNKKLSYTGGIAGYAKNANIKNCYVKGEIYSDNGTDGIYKELPTGATTVIPYSQTGAVVGKCESNATVKYVYSTANVIADGTYTHKHLTQTLNNLTLTVKCNGHDEIVGQNKTGKYTVQEDVLVGENRQGSYATTESVKIGENRKGSYTDTVTVGENRTGYHNDEVEIGRNMKGSYQSPTTTTVGEYRSGSYQTTTYETTGENRSGSKVQRVFSCGGHTGLPPKDIIVQVEWDGTWYHVSSNIDLCRNKVSTNETVYYSWVYTYSSSSTANPYSCTSVTTVSYINTPKTTTVSKDWSYYYNQPSTANPYGCTYWFYVGDITSTTYTTVNKTWEYFYSQPSTANPYGCTTTQIVSYINTFERVYESWTYTYSSPSTANPHSCISSSIAVSSYVYNYPLVNKTWAYYFADSSTLNPYGCTLPSISTTSYIYEDQTTVNQTSWAYYYSNSNTANPNNCDTFSRTSYIYELQNVEKNASWAYYFADSSTLNPYSCTASTIVTGTNIIQKLYQNNGNAGLATLATFQDSTSITIVSTPTGFNGGEEWSDIVAGSQVYLPKVAGVVVSLQRYKYTYNDTATSLGYAGAILGNSNLKSGDSGFFLNTKAVTGSVAAYNKDSAGGSIAKTSTQLKSAATYSGWENFNGVWKLDSGINEGFPYIQSLVGYDFSIFTGEGNQASPYQVSTSAQLMGIAQAYNDFSFTTADIYYKLMNDINLNDATFRPIGHTNAFSGHFDGQGFEISGLKIDENYLNVGLFGRIATGGSVKKLTVSAYGNGIDYDIADYVGGVAGLVDSGGSVIDCAFNGNINGYLNTAKTRIVKGAVGYYTGSDVKTCVSAWTHKTFSSSGNTQDDIIQITNSSGNIVNNYNLELRATFVSFGFNMDTIWDMTENVNLNLPYLKSTQNYRIFTNLYTNGNVAFPVNSGFGFENIGGVWTSVVPKYTYTTLILQANPNYRIQSLIVDGRVLNDAVSETLYHLPLAVTSDISVEIYFNMLHKVSFDSNEVFYQNGSVNYALKENNPFTAINNPKTFEVNVFKGSVVRFMFETNSNAYISSFQINGIDAALSATADGAEILYATPLSVTMSGTYYKNITINADTVIKIVFSRKVDLFIVSQMIGEGINAPSITVDAQSNTSFTFANSITGSSLTLNSGADTGNYKFVGWAYEKDGKNVIVSTEREYQYVIDENKTITVGSQKVAGLKAVFIKKISLTINLVGRPADDLEGNRAEITHAITGLSQGLTSDVNVHADYSFVDSYTIKVFASTGYAISFSGTAGFTFTPVAGGNNEFIVNIPLNTSSGQITITWTRV